MSEEINTFPMYKIQVFDGHTQGSRLCGILEGHLANR